jgi:predicted AAA+ superfamily ATPase
LADLPGIPEVLDRAGMLDVPRARVAVLDGTNRAPGQPSRYANHTINTLWGDLAWQLGGEDAFGLISESDTTGTSPGKEILRQLLASCAPCVVLLDELVVYMRQFAPGQRLSGGSFESNLSFLQSLTEAAKLVPTAVILASLPESDNQAGGSQGVVALQAMEELFNRVQAIWKTVGKEESFEIVRRRLFEPILNLVTRDKVCRAFADAYLDEGTTLPAESREARYYERLQHAYPVHPEVFERLYEDWTTIPGFQRTRGVLKLMAKVIHRLWKDQNADLLILPGSLPLYDGGGCRAELIYHLGPGWDPVVDRDIDGPGAETVELEGKETRFGMINAACRVARTIFLGSAPSSIAAIPGNRGIDRGRVLLGCLQPGQTASIYGDALNRLADRLHYLNASGDKNDSNTRFWFDTRANLRREMEDRKARFKLETDVRAKMAEVMKKITAHTSCVDGTHIFTPHGDVPDDGALRLVVLGLEKSFSKQEPKLAFDEIQAFLKHNGPKPRYRQNRLLFLAADQTSLSRLSDCIRGALAWRSIVEDVKSGRLNIDQIQMRQAEKETSTAEDVLPRVARECYKWLLCPAMHTVTESKPEIEVFVLNTAGASCGAEIERICQENELVIHAWSPVHLRDMVLRKYYWKPDRISVRALDVWEDMQRYLYLPRLRSRATFDKALLNGSLSSDFFGIANGEHDGQFDGFRFGGGSIQLDDTLLLIDPIAAASYNAGREKAAAPSPVSNPLPATPGGMPPSPSAGEDAKAYPGKAPDKSVKIFSGKADVNPSLAKIKLIQLAEEVISVLSADPTATVRVSLEIEAEFPNGATDSIRRSVSENAKQLGMKRMEWS